MKNSGIAWTDHTFNPWSGCLRVSPGCDNCYAAALSRRFGTFGTFGSWQPGAPRRPQSPAYWRQPLSWDRAAGRAGVRYRVFCASMADVFDNAAPVELRARLFELIRITPNLDWLLLTKRIQNAARMLPPDWRNGYGNVWLGVSTENQKEADRRIPLLQAIPARVRFLSCEPLLELIEPDLTGIHMVIAGGERSSSGARFMPPAWPRALRDQCAKSQVAFFMKQMSSVKGKMQPIPPDLMVRQFLTVT